MNKIDFSRILSLDGAMGTQLQARGLQTGEIPELWNLTHPDDVRAIHRSYVAAGADIILANTFGASPAKWHGDAADLPRVIAAGIEIGKSLKRSDGDVASPGASDVPVASSGASDVPVASPLVALDVGPSGRLLKPAGDFEFDAAYASFAEQVKIGAAAGADLVFIETMSDTYELKAAVLAAKENCDLPVFATVALQADGKLLTGGSVEAVAALLEGLRVDALGFNCGLGPDLMLPYVERLRRATALPLIVKPNAGLPKVVDGETRFMVGPEAFAADVVRCVAAGATVVGGCCGTTPAHIRAANDALRGGHGVTALPNAPGRARTPCAPHRACVISSYAKSVELPFDDTLVIGERINPTGKKKLKAAYQAGDTAYILREAIAQVEAGAHILDVNAGVPGIDEPKVLAATVEAIQGVTDTPLQVDTSDPAALEAALRHYNGKALVNSVNGKEEVMDAVFPLVKKYGGVVVALTLDEKGIPATAEGRVAIARKILARGADFGLTKDDFLIDVLSLAVSADAQSANVILEALRRVREELGCRTVLGVSNISFGLPARPLLNAAFYTLALGAGLSAAIVNPLSDDMMRAYRAFRALTGRDVACADWIAYAGNMPEVSVPGRARTPCEPQAGGGHGVTALPSPAKHDGLDAAIQHGLKADAASLATALLASGKTPVELIDGEIVPALEVVGKGFEAGKVFLPQLLMSAEAASAAFEVIKRQLERQGTVAAPRGPIVIATVKGDIHDIGKNIVRALLENYGFRVIDLGRDVPPEKVVEAAVKNGCRLVGLSALMTTTVKYMAETIKLLKAADPSIKTFVGGAVLTADYAAEIGATWYAKDAMASVRLAENAFPPVES